MRIVPRLFVFDEEEVPAEIRAQRNVNKARIPDISTYLIDNNDDYTLSSLTASIDAQVNFEPFSDLGENQNIGTLSINKVEPLPGVTPATTLVPKSMHR